MVLASFTTATAGIPYRGDLTCRDFLSLDTTHRPNIVYWVQGINNKGKPEDAVVDIASTEKVIPIVVEQCRADPMASFWTKLDASWRQFEASVKSHL